MYPKYLPTRRCVNEQFERVENFWASKEKHTCINKKQFILSACLEAYTNSSLRSADSGAIQNKCKYFIQYYNTPTRAALT